MNKTLLTLAAVAVLAIAGPWMITSIVEYLQRTHQSAPVPRGTSERIQAQRASLDEPAPSRRLLGEVFIKPVACSGRSFEPEGRQLRAHFTISQHGADLPVPLISGLLRHGRAR